MTPGPVRAGVRSQSFTGRSGAFYKYEGLGSIYWHMVSKLLVAVQETWTGPPAKAPMLR